jgi:hypothetical protein
MKEHDRIMKWTAYLVIVTWIAALIGVSWLMYALTSGARVEFSRLFSAPPVAQVTTQTAVQNITRLEDVPVELKANLSAGLNALADSLTTYQAKIAAGATQPTPTDTARN